LPPEFVHVYIPVIRWMPSGKSGYIPYEKS
jgi:hypothetical protein